PESSWPVGPITVYSAGAFDPTAAKKGRPVTVQGHRGYFGNLRVANGVTAFVGQGSVLVAHEPGATPSPPRSTPSPSSSQPMPSGIRLLHAAIPAAMPQPPRPSLAWEDAPDSWAVVQASWSKNPLADTQLIAEHVRIGDHQPLRMPFKLGWVPDGLVAAGA